ncbi:hypothetical protein [Actinomadura macrotermitis]|uniref:Uncharacterized protein n=1 Tax=Actinomadura macrotermitis TaxID=2585200 RepID=A0A7K0BSF4_9ACTN|nr:hypothetical protein [Actinomadura macrotermitis]MQY04128.1 hypothetical protein [Actinomadura macrotermitis]
MSLDDDLRDAVQQRLTERLERAAQRRDKRAQQLSELSERRQHGLRARHAAKLNRAAGAPPQDTGQGHA